jgi:transposase
MTKRNYKEGQNRHLALLFPPSLDEYVSEGNPVRAIDVYVETLDLAALGFRNSEPGLTAGQPAFHPGLLVKLYLYGYLNGIRSSRKLEREAVRNVEAIWLAGNLRPGYKTIANFRKDNGKALRAANRDFILLCRHLGLLGGEEVAVDGSFFKGDASKDGIYTADRLERQLAELDRKIGDYQARMDAQDAADDGAGLGSLSEDAGLAEKIRLLKQRQAEKKALQDRLEKSADTQVSTVDPDARLLSKRGQAVDGYNAQIAVDGKHKLVVAAEVTQDGNDTRQLVPMLDKAQDILQSSHLVGLGDTGYYSGEQIKLAGERGYEVYVPVPKKECAVIEEGRFTRERFAYDAADDCYRCPQGERLDKGGQPVEKRGRRVWVYQSRREGCDACPLRKQCLSERADTKKVTRWEHEDVVDRHRAHMAGGAAAGRMRRRASLAEHPFGTLKHRAGMHHFLMRGLEKCRGEFSLMALCYNLTRVLNILGIDKFREGCARWFGNGAGTPSIA